MSIYASWPAPGDDHWPSCAVYVEREDGVYDFSGGRCDCGLSDAPLVYQGSGHLPSPNDERGGWVDISSIAGHITRDGRDDGPEDGELWPFLRLGVNNATVVLNREGVELVHRSLTEWLERTS